MRCKLFSDLRPLKRCICYEPIFNKLFWWTTSKCSTKWFWKIYIQCKRKNSKTYNLAVTLFCFVFFLFCFLFLCFINLQYTSVNWNTQGNRHFLRISECSKYQKLRKNQEFWQWGRFFSFKSTFLQILKIIFSCYLLAFLREVLVNYASNMIRITILQSFENKENFSMVLITCRSSFLSG